MNEQKTVLVTGATGRQGGAVARVLLSQGYHVRAMTRRPDGDKARELFDLGVTVVGADLDDADSLERVLQGAWGVFSVQNTWEAGVAGEEAQGKRLAELAKKAGVHAFVYSSVASADRETGIPHFDNKHRVEEAVLAYRFPAAVVLRPVFFMENFVSPWFKPGIDQGKLLVAVAPETVLQMIAVSDIGRYAGWAFEQAEALNGRAIDIAGDAGTMPSAAGILGDAAGRPIEYVHVPLEEVRRFSEDIALMMAWFDRVGYDVDMEARAGESGITPTTLAQWAGEVRWG